MSKLMVFGEGFNFVKSKAREIIFQATQKVNKNNVQEAIEEVSNQVGDISTISTIGTSTTGAISAINSSLEKSNNQFLHFGNDANWTAIQAYNQNGQNISRLQVDAETKKAYVFNSSDGGQSFSGGALATSEDLEKYTDYTSTTDVNGVYPLPDTITTTNFRSVLCLAENYVAMPFFGWSGTKVGVKVITLQGEMATNKSIKVRIFHR